MQISPFGNIVLVQNSLHHQHNTVVFNGCVIEFGAASVVLNFVDDHEHRLALADNSGGSVFFRVIN